MAIQGRPVNDPASVGFGLAAAVVLAAALIRPVPAPASMTILGKWKNWYLPSWMGWLPQVNAERTLSHPAGGSSSASAARKRAWVSGSVAATSPPKLRGSGLL